VNNLTESLTKARDCAGLTENDIREALAAANAVEFIVLLDALQQAEEIRRRLDALIEARELT